MKLVASPKFAALSATYMCEDMLQSGSINPCQVSTRTRIPEKIQLLLLTEYYSVCQKTCKAASREQKDSRFKSRLTNKLDVDGISQSYLDESYKAARTLMRRHSR